MTADDRETLRRRRGLPVRLAVVALLVVAGVAVAVALRPPPVTAPTSLHIDRQARAELLDNLASRGRAGIAAWLVTHPGPPPLTSATRFFTVEVAGTGSRTVRLAPEAGAGAGRATVLFVVAVATDATWRLGDGKDLAVRGGSLSAGELTSATVRHGAADVPDRLTVSVPAGVRWGAAVVYSD